MARYLNTSMISESVGNSPVGWLIPYRKTKEVREPLEEIKIEKPEEEEEYELKEYE